MVTKDDRDRGEGQEWEGDEESQEGEGRASREITKDSLCDTRARIHLCMVREE